MKREKVDKFLNKFVIVNFPDGDIAIGTLRRIKNHMLDTDDFYQWNIRDGYCIDNLGFRLSEIQSIEEVDERDLI